MIIVTARSRAENLLETPLALTAFSSEALEAKGIVSINDLVLNTPGINASSVRSGRSDRSFQQLSMRGMTPTTPASTLVATFINGVPVASATALNSVSDPERIEVIKGPQVAYLGRNAFAGAVNVVTKDPRDEFSGKIDAMVGTRNNHDIMAAVEGGIVEDVLAFRVMGRSHAKGGSYKNQAAAGEMLGDQRTETVSLQLLFKPTSRLTIKPFAMYTQSTDGPSAQGVLSGYELRSVDGEVNIPFFSGSNEGQLVLPKSANCILSGLESGISADENKFDRSTFCGQLPNLPNGTPAVNTIADGLLAKSLADGRGRYLSPKRGAQGYGLKSRYHHLSLTLDYEFGDSGLTFSSLTGYNNEAFSVVQDLDSYDNSLFVNPNATPANGLRPFWTFSFMLERQNKDFSQQLRFNYEPVENLRLMAGGSYLYTYSQQAQTNILTEEQAGAERADVISNAPQKARTFAAFGSLEYDVTEKLTLSLEGRWQQDEIYAYSNGRGVTLSQSVADRYGLPAGSFRPLSVYYSQKFDNFAPKIIGNYKFSSDLMAYASWAKAANVSLGSFNTTFLSNGQVAIDAADTINLGVIVQPERLNQFEVGLKGQLFDRAVSFTLAAYQGKWSDQHNERSAFYLDDVNGVETVRNATGLVNSGRTTLRGVELDVHARLLKGFTVDLSAAVNDSIIRSFSDPQTSKLTGLIGADFKGNQLPLTSKYSGNLGVAYQGGAPWEDGSWFIRTDVSYKSKQYVNASNLSWIGDRTQVNARLGVSKGNFTMEAFAINLFNNKQYVSAIDTSLLEPTYKLSPYGYGYVSVALPELRTLGLRSRYSF